MTMQLLFDGRFGEYFRAAAMGDEPCIFVHVPKTAGTSLRAELAMRRQPDVNIVVDYADASRTFREQMSEAVSRFIEKAPRDGVRFASGHLQGDHVERIRRELPGARFVTLLRDPLERVVSDYRHQRSPRHDGHLDFIARVPSLEAYVELAGEQDKMARHLVEPSVFRTRDPEACIDHLLHSYDFVGMLDLYPLSFRVLTTLIGAPGWPTLRENVALESEPPPDIDPALAERIRAANPLDCAIHAAFLERWQAIEAPLLEAIG